MKLLRYPLKQLAIRVVYVNPQIPKGTRKGGYMPMWISWVNPRTHKRERLYNYADQDTEEGEKAIEIARRGLSLKFNIPQSAILGFHVEEAPWLPFSRRHPKAG